MRDGLKLARAAIARRACLFNFLPSQQKVKSAFGGLCDLCDSSDLSGRSSQSEA